MNKNKIVAHGAPKAGGLLPGYPVSLLLLDGSDVVHANDLLLFGKDRTQLGAWTHVNDGSVFIGETVDNNRAGHGADLVFARKEDV